MKESFPVKELSSQDERSVPGRRVGRLLKLTQLQKVWSKKAQITGLKIEVLRIHEQEGGRLQRAYNNWFHTKNRVSVK
jgi:hypothetical protein